MPGMRPSGLCGDPPVQCYTQGDRDAIDAEIDVAEAEINVLQAEYEDLCNQAGAKQQELNAAQTTLSNLQSEKQSAINNSCPQ